MIPSATFVFARAFSLALGAAVMLAPSPASAQDIVEGAKEAFNTVIESKQTRMRRELQEQEQLRRQEEEARWQQELAERERQNNQRTGTSPLERSSRRPVRVEVFVANDCPECDQLRDFLKEAGVSYELYELDRDPAAEREYLAQVGRGVIPVTRIGSAIVRGYEPERVRAAIQDAKLHAAPAAASRSKSGESWRAGSPPTGAVAPELPPAASTTTTTGSGSGSYIPYEGARQEPADATADDLLQGDKY